MALRNLPWILRFFRDQVETAVSEDTVDPSKSRPLPVKLTGITGDVNIDAANVNLEVQLTDEGANYDAVRIGDGTERLDIIQNAARVAVQDSNGDAITSINPLDVTANFSGLHVGGRISEVTLSSAAWTALPAVALVGRNAISIQNVSGVEIKINYNSFAALPAGYTGVVIPVGGERYYDITDTISIFAKAQAGSPIIIVEELA